MSGGVAFVYDRDDHFNGLYNPEMVDLEPLSADDRIWLKDRITLHRDETGSEVARHVLLDWSTTWESFVKVMPRDYRRVLEATELAVAEGRSVDEAVMAAPHG
jgi:glutamate synthase (NADPH/NADH) large chain